MSFVRKIVNTFNTILKNGMVRHTMGKERHYLSIWC